MRVWALVALLCFWAALREPFVGGASKRAWHVARHFKNAPEASAPNKLEDVWRYIGGWYEIKNIEGKLYFRENNLQGELVAEGDWLVAELPPSGTIRLKLGDSGNEVLSNFKPSDADWGETITALREWDSLTERTENLHGALGSATFQGVSNGVTVTVDGRQRPVGLSIETSSPKLGQHIKEAHESAVEQSVEAMTENLQELYASHFGAKK